MSYSDVKLCTTSFIAKHDYIIIFMHGFHEINNIVMWLHHMAANSHIIPLILYVANYLIKTNIKAKDNSLSVIDIVV